MPQGASRKKKAAPRKTAKKKAAKKTVRKKKIVRKKLIKKKTSRKTTGKRPAQKRATTQLKASPKQQTAIEPGPPPRIIPPVEEPALNEEAIGTVTHYYSHLSVAVVQVNKGTLKIGNAIHIKGHVTDFTQTIESMEYEHQHIDQASAGQNIGLMVKDHAREHDIVYLVK